MSATLRVAAAAMLVVSAFAAADERGLLLPWETLSKVSLVKQGDRFVPVFPKELTALDKAQVKLQGFMMPLEAAAKQKRFLLSALPSDCGFCMSAGPDQLVEVQAKQGFTYVLDASRFPEGWSFCATTRAGSCTA